MELLTNISKVLKPAVIISCIFLVACVDEKPDLHNYIAEIKATQKPDIEPVPVMKPYQKFDYAASDLRDPFTATVVDLALKPEAGDEADNGIKPDQHRRKEALEAFPLSELQFVGTLEREGVWALIRTSDGVINRVHEGNYMGHNHGKILSINATEIVLKEIVADANGRFVERDTKLPIVEVN